MSRTRAKKQEETPPEDAEAENDMDDAEEASVESRMPRARLAPSTVDDDAEEEDDGEEGEEEEEENDEDTGASLAPLPSKHAEDEEDSGDDDPPAEDEEDEEDEEDDDGDQEQGGTKAMASSKATHAPSSAKGAEAEDEEDDEEDDDDDEKPAPPLRKGEETDDDDEPEHTKTEGAPTSRPITPARSLINGTAPSSAKSASSTSSFLSSLMRQSINGKRKSADDKSGCKDGEPNVKRRKTQDDDDDKNPPPAPASSSSSSSSKTKTTTSSGKTTTSSTGGGAKKSAPAKTGGGAKTRSASVKTRKNASKAVMSSRSITRVHAVVARSGMMVNRLQHPNRRKIIFGHLRTWLERRGYTVVSNAGQIAPTETEKLLPNAAGVLGFCHFHGECPGKEPLYILFVAQLRQAGLKETKFPSRHIAVVYDRVTNPGCKAVREHMISCGPLPTKRAISESGAGAPEEGYTYSTSIFLEPFPSFQFAYDPFAHHYLSGSVLRVLNEDEVKQLSTACMVQPSKLSRMRFDDPLRSYIGCPVGCVVYECRPSATAGEAHVPRVVVSAPISV